MLPRDGGGDAPVEDDWPTSSNGDGGNGGGGNGVSPRDLVLATALRRGLLGHCGARHELLLSRAAGPFGFGLSYSTF